MVASVLKPGQLIGIIALSSACEAQLFQRGIKHLESFGFRTKVVLDPCKNYGRDTHLFSSDSAKARAKALEDLFLDREVAAIISARGAYGCMEILPELDFALISQHPKRLIGFSDLTALLLAVYGKSGIPCIHGPTLCSAFSNANENKEARQSAKCLVDFLTGTVIDPYKGLEVELISGKGEARGLLVGGNLSLVNAMIGTPWEPDYKGHILFLEEKGEKPYRVHRMLLQLKLAGRFKGLKGVVLGSFKNCEHTNGIGASLAEVFRDIFASEKFPVVGMIPAGHGDWNLPIPFGQEARISEGKFSLLPPA